MSWLCVAVACLPEGIRLLSVFLTADEYKDLVQCCGSSEQPVMKPADPVEESGSVGHTVHAESCHTECAAVVTGHISQEGNKFRCVHLSVCLFSLLLLNCLFDLLFACAIS